MKKRELTKTLLAIFLFVAGFVPIQSKILMKPYLQAVTRNSIIVMVETDTKDAVIVQYGKERKFSASERTAFYRIAENRRETTYIHRIKLVGLLPDTKYNYRAIQGKDTTDIFTFRTAVPEGTPFRVGIMGDNRSNPEVHSRKSKKMKDLKLDFSIYTGDLCYSGKYYDWKKEFFTPEEQDLIACVPFYNSLGNHEGQTELTRVFLQAPESNSNDEYYYSFDYGDAHFLILNTETNVQDGSKQFEFAKNDLANTKKKWKIVAFHIPAYTAGSHKPSKSMQEFSRKIFEPFGVDIVLNGHNHFYQRSYVNGIYHIVCAGGGAPLYKPETANFVQKSFQGYHYGVMDITTRAISVKIFDLRGTLIDEFEIKK